MTDFTLRPWREADAASIARYADNAKIAANLRDVFPCPYAPQDAATFVESCIRQEGRGQMCRAIEVDGEAAGSIGLFLGSDVYRRSAELGYWLGGPRDHDRRCGNHVPGGLCSLGHRPHPR